MTNDSEPACEGVSDSSPARPADLPRRTEAAPENPTDIDAASPAAASPAGPSGSRAWWSRVAGWLSAQEAISRACEREALLTPARRAILRQARAFADAADWLVESASEPPLGPVLVLYRQAVLLLLSTEISSACQDPLVLDGQPGLSEPAGGAANLSRIQAALATPTAGLVDDLPKGEQVTLIALCQRFVRHLLEREQAEPLRHAVHLRRWRWATVGLLLVLTAAAGVGVAKFVTAPTDLARGRTWRTSSTFPGGIPSSLMFHTDHEVNPWLELDLGEPTVISSIIVRNRTDCCMDRADPLLVETSTDRRDWRQIGRHDGLFRTWEPVFAPVTARYLRFMVPRYSALHFEQVNVY